MSKVAEFLRNPVFRALAGAALCFGAGFGSYRAILEIAHLDTVPKDSYVLKQDLIGRVIGVEALAEIEHLVEIGEKLSGNVNDSRTWLLRTVTFVHEVKLEQDTTVGNTKMSTVEKDIRWSLEDPSVESQVQKTLGVLQGLRSAFRARVPANQRQH